MSGASEVRNWQDSGTGLDCITLRTPLGHLCGYVGVPKDHPWYQQTYWDCGQDINVHGGITYTDWEPTSREAKEGLWYFGFDCAHVGDNNVPLEYVKAEVAKLAAQLKEVAEK